MNIVAIIGRMARDAEVRYTASQTAVANFTVAVDRPPKDGKKEADFIRCIAFNKTAEMVEKYFHKGKQIALQGHINTGSYEKDGQKIYTTDVVADRVEFVGPKEERKEQDDRQKQQTYSGFQTLDELEDCPF